MEITTKQHLLVLSIWLLLLLNSSCLAQSLDNPTSNYDLDHWIGQGGCWNFSTGIIQGQALLGHNKAIYTERNYEDFVYEVRTKKLSENGPFGLLFRYDEKEDEGYCFLYWPVGGYRLELIAGGQERNGLIKAHKTPFRYQGLNVWNTVKITARGPVFNIYINGYLVETATDTTFISGKLGLYIHGDPRQKAQFEVLNLDVLK